MDFKLVILPTDCRVFVHGRLMILNITADNLD